MIVDVALEIPVGIAEAIRPKAAEVTQAEFENFYRETARPLWAYLRRICGDPALADDLLQESYLRFCRARARAGDTTGWKPYLYRIATNLVADWWRHAGHGPVVGASENSESPVQAGPDSEAVSIRRRDVDRAFAALKPRERALLWLAYVEGLEHREIALSLGLSRGSIKVLLFRARRKLAEVLERKGIGPEVLT
jgi:RNA polymerase sigma-70 factor (ECF subfamily)